MNAKDLNFYIFTPSKIDSKIYGFIRFKMERFENVSILFDYYIIK